MNSRLLRPSPEVFSSKFFEHNWSTSKKKQGFIFRAVIITVLVIRVYGLINMRQNHLQRYDIIHNFKLYTFLFHSCVYFISCCVCFLFIV